MQREDPDAKPEEQAAAEPTDPGETRHDQSSTGENPQDPNARLATAPSGSGVWGKMPPREVEQVFDNGRLKLPERYRLFLEKYYQGLPKGPEKD